MPGKASKAPAQGRNAAIRVVFVTLDNHLSGAVDRAEALLVKDMPGLSIGFHAAADWGRDPGALDAARADIARADIVIAKIGRAHV